VDDWTFNPLRAEFFWTKPSLRAAAGYIRLKCFHLPGKQRTNADISGSRPGGYSTWLGTYHFQFLGHERKFLAWGPPVPGQWNKMPPLTIVAFFISIYEKIRLLYAKNHCDFLLWQVWWFFDLCDLDLLTLMLKVKFLCIKWKLTCSSITCPSFLLIQQQLKFWWFF
jgi:hypothetical protein